jgi:hypothetical protein
VSKGCGAVSTTHNDATDRQEIMSAVHNSMTDEAEVVSMVDNNSGVNLMENGVLAIQILMLLSM